jgi:hypothetical protein
MYDSDQAMGRYHKTLLYDFYGAMLTEHQRKCFTLYHEDDYSLSEIGAEMEITPQAVSDMLKRTTQKLEKFEIKLGLVQRYLLQQDTANYMRSLIKSVEEPLRKSLLTQLDALLRM